MFDKKAEVSEQFRLLLNDKICYFYKSPNVVRVIKSWKLGWAWHVVRNRKYRIHIEFLWANFLGNVHLEGQQRDGSCSGSCPLNLQVLLP